MPTLVPSAGLLARLRSLAGANGVPGVIYARISEDREGSGLGVERQLDDQCSLFTQLAEYVAQVIVRPLRTGEERSDISHGAEQPQLTTVPAS